MPETQSSAAEMATALRKLAYDQQVLAYANGGGRDDAAAQSFRDAATVLRSAADALERAEEENAKMREALAPIAQWAVDWQDAGDERPAWPLDAHPDKHGVTVGDLRRARRAARTYLPETDLNG